VKLERVRGAALLALVLSATASSVAAQTAEQPLLVFSTFGGYIGGARLWRLDNQLAATWTGIDSLTLGRVFVPGFALGMGVSLFRSPHWGYNAEIAFLGTTTESRCNPAGTFKPDTAHMNQYACQDIQGTLIRTNLVAVQGGLIWRPISSGTAQPYLRGSVGAAIVGGSFVQTSGSFSPTEGRLVYLDEEKRQGLTWVATLGAGAILEVSPAYQFRFELRDLVFNVPVVTGPANYLAVEPWAELGHKTVHLPAITVAFDISLERRRTRRY